MPKPITNLKFKFDRIKALFVGPSGTGKSISAVTFPRPLYIMDCDTRIRSITNFFHKRPDFLDGITYDTFHNFSEFVEAFERLEMLSARNQLPYKTILIDSVTSIAQSALRHGLKEKAGGVSKLLSGSGGLRIAGVAIPGWDEWNMEATVFREILYAISHEFKCNVILTAHQYSTEETETVTGTDGRKTTQKVNKYHILTGAKKAAASLPVDFDEIYYFKRSGSDHNVFTREVDEFDYVKTALALPRKITVTMKPNVERDGKLKPIDEYNGALYAKILKHCKENGMEVAE